MVSTVVIFVEGLHADDEAVYFFVSPKRLLTYILLVEDCTAVLRPPVAPTHRSVPRMRSGVNRGEHICVRYYKIMCVVRTHWLKLSCASQIYACNAAQGG